MSVAALSARFVPSASLPNAPEDVLVSICSLISTLDILSLRLCSRRLYHITRSRIIWLQTLQKLYTRRFLPPPTRTSHLSIEQIEHKATRPWKLLHALSDIAHAQPHIQKYPVLDRFLGAIPVAGSDPLSPPVEPGPAANTTRPIAATYISPGGKWLVVVANTRLHVPIGGSAVAPGNRTCVGLLVVFNLSTHRAVLRRPFHRPVHYANIRSDEEYTGVEIVVGYEKLRLDEPYFSAMYVRFPDEQDDEEEEPAFERLGAIRVSRTPRACSVHGDILAFADRIGNICFWNWREQTHARIFVVGWPPTKGKIMLLAPHLLAVFNPASSSFAVFMVPPLKPITHFEDPSTGQPAAIQPAEPGPGPNHFPPPPNLDPGPLPNNGPQYPLARFRLPSRGLLINTPSSVRASTFLRDNASFPEPFLAYFVLVQPESPSVLHLGVVPELDAQGGIGRKRRRRRARTGGEARAGSTEEDEGEDDEASEDDDDLEVSVDGALTTHNSIAQLGNVSAAVSQAEISDIGGIAGPSSAQQNPPGPAGVQQPPPPEMIEPSWLRTLRLTDHTTDSTFSPTGQILHIGPLDHNIAIIRSTEDESGRIEIFTTAGMYAEPEKVEPPPALTLRRLREAGVATVPVQVDYRPPMMPYFGVGVGGGGGLGGVDDVGQLSTGINALWAAGSSGSLNTPPVLPDGSYAPHGGHGSVSISAPPPDPSAHPPVSADDSGALWPPFGLHPPLLPPHQESPSTTSPSPNRYRMVLRRVPNPRLMPAPPVVPPTPATSNHPPQTNFQRLHDLATTSLLHGAVPWPPQQSPPAPSPSTSLPIPPQRPGRYHPYFTQYQRHRFEHPRNSNSNPTSNSNSSPPGPSNAPSWHHQTFITLPDQPLVPPTPLRSQESRSPAANLHSRLGASIEGDFQYLSYHVSDEHDLIAATADDVSGKIVLIEGCSEEYHVIVLDYGYSEQVEDVW